MIVKNKILKFWSWNIIMSFCCLPTCYSYSLGCHGDILLVPNCQAKKQWPYNPPRTIFFLMRTQQPNPPGHQAPWWQLFWDSHHHSHELRQSLMLPNAYMLAEGHGVAGTGSSSGLPPSWAPPLCSRPSPSSLFWAMLLLILSTQEACVVLPQALQES